MDGENKKVINYALDQTLKGSIIIEVIKNLLNRVGIRCEEKNQSINMFLYFLNNDFNTKFTDSDLKIINYICDTNIIFIDLNNCGINNENQFYNSNQYYNLWIKKENISGQQVLEWLSLIKENCEKQAKSEYPIDNNLIVKIRDYIKPFYPLNVDELDLPKLLYHLIRISNDKSIYEHELKGYSTQISSANSGIQRGNRQTTKKDISRGNENKDEEYNKCKLKNSYINIKDLYGYFKLIENIEKMNNEQKKIDILYIDDKPENYAQEIKSTLEWLKYEVHLETLKIAKYNTDAINYEIVEKISEYNSMLLSEYKNNENIKKFVEKIRKSFILVDLYYENNLSDNKPSGIKIIKGIQRIIRDYNIKDKNNNYPQIIALSGEDSPEIIQEAIRNGARDYVLKNRLFSLPVVLEKIRNSMPDSVINLHRNFRCLNNLPNETIGLLQTIKIPRIEHSQYDSKREHSKKIEEIIRAIPKADLHVHLGTCMPLEFVIFSATISLLEYYKDEKIWSIFVKVSEKIKDILNQYKEGNIKDWKKQYAEEKRNEIKRKIDDSGCNDYKSFRSEIHSELGIENYLSCEDAKNKLMEKKDFDIICYAIRKEIYNEKKIKNMKGDPHHNLKIITNDLIRKIYIILIAQQNYEMLYNDGNKGIDLLEKIFDGSQENESNKILSKIHKLFYDDNESEESKYCISNFRKNGWNLPVDKDDHSKKDNNGLKKILPISIKRKEGDNLNLLKYEVESGRRSRNLEEYLEGCEFVGAEFLKHPFLIHLFAQSVIINFIRDGVFYAELRAAPDGYVNPENGFEFAHVCRCLVEAFNNAQSIIFQLFKKCLSEKNDDKCKSEIKWLAGVLGEDYEYDNIKNKYFNKNWEAIIGRKYPCKISLIFTGKRHKPLKEMILEAAAATVMRPSGESAVSNGAEFVEKEMQRCRVVGFDLAGREYDNPPELFQIEFSRLSRLHIPLTVHAGENAPSRFIEDAIILLDARRIGHGLSIVEDPHLMVRAREQRVCIELCPVSNHQTSTFSPPESPLGNKYPLKTLLEKGIYVTLCTDNPVISDTNLVKEFFQASYAYDETGLSLWEALRIIRMGFVNSFLHLPERRAMIEVVEQIIYDLFTDENTVDKLREISKVKQN